MKAAVRIRHCPSLADVRREIDRLDQQIVRLLAERAGYVGEAARVKETASQIVDRARIEEVVGRAGARAEALGADGETIARIYRAMIDAFISFERRAFANKDGANKDGAKKKKDGARKKPANKARTASPAKRAGTAPARR